MRCGRSWRPGTAPEQQPRHQEILAFLENEIGLEALKRRRVREAARRFEAAIELDSQNAPAYLNLGDVRLAQGDTLAAAIRPGSDSSSTSPERAYLAFSRLEKRVRPAGRRSDDFLPCAGG